MDDTEENRSCKRKIRITIYEAGGSWGPEDAGYYF